MSDFVPADLSLIAVIITAGLAWGPAAAFIVAVVWFLFNLVTA